MPGIRAAEPMPGMLICVILSIVLSIVSDGHD
jgi:hypothetical protein